MKTFVPNYYKQFKCIADKCKHSCCIGWEINIDEVSLEYYRSLDTDFGAKIRANIDFDCECPHFVLKEGDRCPFLNENNLCDMICEIGDEALCGICSDHPRFRNFLFDSVEEGIGLSCEEAARIILCEKERFSLAEQNDDEFLVDGDESEILSERKYIFSLLQNRTVPFSSRLEMLSSEYGFSLSEFCRENISKLFLSLERLDDKWTDLLNSADFEGVSQFFDCDELSSSFENLACYFVFRHFFDCIIDDRKISRVKFVVASCVLISAMCCSYYKKYGRVEISDMVEICRMFSSEVEYSEDNLDILFDSL